METTAMQDLRAMHLVTTDWLSEHLSDKDLRIVDMRGYVRVETEDSGKQAAHYLGAREEYLEGHIPGAVYIDWTQDIVDTDDEVEAQLAGPEKFADSMNRAGISSDTLVIAYDNHPTSQFATRLWWALRYYRHNQCRVLDGGLARWVREARELSRAPLSPPTGEFIPRISPEWRVTFNEVKAEVDQQSSQLLDARDQGQYVGRIIRGKHGGHVPGAIHFPREQFIAEDGQFRASDEILGMADDAGITSDKRVIAYCNGGVAATTALFALLMVGITNLANYDGSWNEWGNRDDAPVEKP